MPFLSSNAVPANSKLHCLLLAFQQVRWLHRFFNALFFLYDLYWTTCQSHLWKFPGFKIFWVLQSIYLQCHTVHNYLCLKPESINTLATSCERSTKMMVWRVPFYQLPHLQTQSTSFWVFSRHLIFVSMCSVITMSTLQYPNLQVAVILNLSNLCPQYRIISYSLILLTQYFLLEHDLMNELQILHFL